jgi:hypothetical protein
VRERARPARWEREWAASHDRGAVHRTLGPATRARTQMTARTSCVTKRQRAAREAVRRSISGRRSGYVMPTEGGMTRGSERTRF